MKNLAAAVAIAVSLAATDGFAPSASLACMPAINFEAIDREMAKPALDPSVRVQAKSLKIRAVAEIENGHRAEGRRLYFQLMELLGLSRPNGRFRC